MSDRQVRLSQLIAPFGPGSIYTDKTGTPLVVCGLDFWHKSVDDVEGRADDCDDLSEFVLNEPRLQDILKVDGFRRPPDYRTILRGSEPPPNAKLCIPVQRFPRWYRATKSGHLKLVQGSTKRIEPPPDGGRYQPVRFISVCDAGHLNEFPWQAWAGCECDDPDGLVLTDQGGSELSSVRVHCTKCPAGSRGRDLSGVTVKPSTEEESSALQQRGIHCPGCRPWLGESRISGCTRPLVGAMINQTNIYFARTLSALALPDLEITEPGAAQLASAMSKEAMLGPIKAAWSINPTVAVEIAKTALNEAGISYEESHVKPALESLFQANVGLEIAGATTPAEPEHGLLSLRRAEVNVIRNGVQKPPQSGDLYVRPTSIPDLLKPYLSRISLVDRLRETRAFFGFDRLATDNSFLETKALPDDIMRQLFRSPPREQTWLPAVQAHGEGIFYELREEAIDEWLHRNAAAIEKRIDDQFINNLIEVRNAHPPLGEATRDWAARFVLVHTTSHCLINQLVFECGYSSASIKERLYISADGSAPMAGVLLYTAAGDSEGTLGGLVRLGNPDRFGPLFERALNRAYWCSSDPVCSEDLGGRGARQANKAACHACSLLPETSCETINDGLDRALVVGLPEDRSPAFFKDLLDAASSEELANY